MSDNFYSQFNEDRFLVANEQLPEKGVFIDVGAGDPEQFSNSKYFEDKGWDVLCIEPDQRFYDKLAKTRKNVENIAIGKCTGNISFWIAEDFGLSTTTPLDGIKYIEEKKVHCITLDELLLLDEIDHIDILSVDTEGSELTVLDSLSLETYKPTYIIVEFLTVGLPPRDEEIKVYFSNRPYELLLKTEANLIFKRTDVKLDLSPEFS